MQKHPRIFKHRGIYHAEFPGGIRRSLKSRYKSEALKNLLIIQEEIERAIQQKYVLSQVVKLSDFAKIYEAHRIGISEKTLKKDRLTFKLMVAALGDILISDVTPKEIEKFEKSCFLPKTANNRIYRASPLGVNSYLRHLKAALNFARDRKFILEVPKIKMVPTGKQDLAQRIIDRDDMQKILDAAKEARPEFYSYLTILVWTGGRREEVMNLTWPDIDFKDNMIAVTGKGKRQRRIPMMPIVREMLYPIRKDDGRVFSERHLDTISKWFLSIARACGIKARLHDVRHSAVTYMLKSGIPIQVVSKIVGHSNLSTTMGYTHVLEDVMKKEMEKFRFE